MDMGLRIGHEVKSFTILALGTAQKTATASSSSVKTTVVFALLPLELAGFNTDSKHLLALL